MASEGEEAGPALSGGIGAMAPDLAVSTAISAGSTALNIWVWLPLRRMLPAIISAILLSMIAAALGIFVIAQIGRAISTSDEGGVPFGLWAMGGLLLLLLVLNSGARYILSVLAQDTTLQIRQRLVDRIMRASLKRVEEIGPPRIYSALTVDAFQVSRALAVIPIALFSALVIASGIVYLGFLSWRLLAFISVVVAIGVSVSIVAQHRATRILVEERKAQDDLMEAYEALAYGKKEFMLSRTRRQNFLETDLAKILDRIRRTVIRSDLYWEVSSQWSETFLMFLLVAIASLPLSMFGMEHTVLAQALLVTFYLRDPVGSLINFGQQFAQARIALQSLRRLVLDDDSLGETIPSAPANAIELRGVSFSYRDKSGHAAFGLGPIDLCLRRGEVTFITGGNGSGKSTLCKLITGLYTPDSGSILLDGQPPASSHALRSQFSALYFDYFPFPTLPCNEDQLGGSRAVAVHELLDDFNLSGRTRLEGNRWTHTSLSTGQRRRLALISALAEDKSVYLFDEPAADQDPQFRRFLYHDLIPALKRANKAVVVVSHDEGFFATADHLYHLRDGRFQCECEDVVGEPAPTRRWSLPLGLACAAPRDELAEKPPRADEEPLSDRPVPPRRDWIVAGLAVAVIVAVSWLTFSSAGRTTIADPTFDSQRALTRLERWIGDQPHPTGSTANIAIAEDISRLLDEAGFVVQRQDATQCDARDCIALQNIIASRLPNPNEPALLMVAHYDSALAGPGAADNGLGVAALVEFARSSWLRRRSDSNVIVLLTDAEEWGGKGAEAFLRLSPLAARVTAVVNLDSLGSNGPLIAYDLGTGPTSDVARWISAAPGVNSAATLQGLYALMPNTTDLSQFTAAGIPGVSLGYVLGDAQYHRSGDRVESLDPAQIMRLGEALRYAVARFDGGIQATGSWRESIQYLDPGAHPITWGLVLAVVVLVALFRTRPGRTECMRLALASGWWLVALVLSLGLAIALDALDAVSNGGIAASRLLWPLLPWLATLGLAALYRPIGNATIAAAMVLLAAGAAMLVIAPGLAAAPLLAGMAIWLGAHRFFNPLIGPILAFAVTFPLLFDALKLITGVTHSPGATVATLLWAVVWMPWMALTLALRRQASSVARVVAITCVLAAVGFQGWALQPLERAALPTLNIDLVEARHTGEVFQVLRGEYDQPETLEAEGYSRQSRRLFPWSGPAGSQWMREVPARMLTSHSTGTIKGQALELVLPPHRGTLSLTLAVPSAAGLRDIRLDDGQVIPADGLMHVGGYRLFVLRDGIDRHRALQLEFDHAAPRGGLFLTIESLLDPATGVDLRKRGGSLESGYLPDRHIVVEPIAIHDSAG